MSTGSITRRSFAAGAVGIAALGLTGGLAGCSNDKPASASKDGGARRKVKYLSGAAIFGREAYVYVAQDKGFYNEVNLDVEVVAGSATDANLKLLLSSQIDFATVDMNGALAAYSKASAPVHDFTVVTALHQRTTNCIMALPEKNITGPKDLEGKNVGYIPGGVIFTLFPAYAKLAGVDASKVKWVPLQANALVSALTAGQVDAVTQLVVAESSVQAASGKKPAVLSFSEYLSDLYGNVLAVRTDMAKNEPDLVERFRDATLKGLQYAIDNPDESGEIFAKHQPAQKAQAAAGELKLLAPYVRATGKLGTIDPARMARNIAVVQSVGLIPAGVTPESLVNFQLTPKG